MSHYQCKSFYDTLNIEGDLAKHTTHSFEMCFSINSEVFVQNNLRLGPKFHRVPRIEDYWANYENDFEFQRWDLTRLVLRQIKVFNLNWGIQLIEDDDAHLVVPIYVNHIQVQPIVRINWHVKDVKTRGKISSSTQKNQGMGIKENSQESQP